MKRFETTGVDVSLRSSALRVLAGNGKVLVERGLPGEVVERASFLGIGAFPVTFGSNYSDATLVLY